MDFRDAFLLQLKLHKNYTPQDAVKLCYQAAFGPGHMLRDPLRAKTYLQEECQELFPRVEPLWEEISDELVRLNLRPWMEEGLPLNWLFSLFYMTAELAYPEEEAFYSFVSTVRELSREQFTPFSCDDFDSWYEVYLSEGLRAVSHSEEYRRENAPAYRLISKRYLNLITVLQQLHSNPNIRVIAIDGMAGSGKTTLANQLRNILSCDLISMDDFFLPLSRRTPERMEEIGGNIHYERFSEEILPYIREDSVFSYRRFDCGVMDYAGAVSVAPGDYRIVEGSYSCHPAFGNYADLRIFVETDTGTQMERISQRDIPDWMVDKFRASWIPMENRYHEEYKLREHAHMIIST